MPDAGQIYHHDATDDEREYVRSLALQLAIGPNVLPPPDRASSPVSCRVPAGYRDRLDAISAKLRLLPGATRRLAVALGVDVLERAVAEGRR